MRWKLGFDKEGNRQRPVKQKKEIGDAVALAKRLGLAWF